MQHKTYLFNFFFFWWDWGLNSGLHVCKAGAHKASILSPEPHSQFILLWLFWRLGSHKLFIQAGLEFQSSQSQPPK
jgi:hypothetical protein